MDWEAFSTNFPGRSLLFALSLRTLLESDSSHPCDLQVLLTQFFGLIYRILTFQVVIIPHVSNSYSPTMTIKCLNHQYSIFPYMVISTGYYELYRVSFCGRERSKPTSVWNEYFLFVEKTQWCSFLQQEYTRVFASNGKSSPLRRFLRSRYLITTLHSMKSADALYPIVAVSGRCSKIELNIGAYKTCSRYRSLWKGMRTDCKPPPAYSLSSLSGKWRRLREACLRM